VLDRELLDEAGGIDVGRQHHEASRGDALHLLLHQVVETPAPVLVEHGRVAPVVGGSRDHGRDGHGIVLVLDPAYRDRMVLGLG
jgi:hypothetical protein